MEGITNKNPKTKIKENQRKSFTIKLSVIIHLKRHNIRNGKQNTYVIIDKREIVICNSPPNGHQVKPKVAYVFVFLSLINSPGNIALTNKF